MARRVHNWDDVKRRVSMLQPKEIEREALREVDEEIIEGDVASRIYISGLIGRTPDRVTTQVELT